MPAAVTHHYILTLQKAGLSATSHGELRPQPGARRAQVLADLIASVTKANPQFENANVMFFALEPAQI